MHITLTIRVGADSKQELIDSFPSTYKNFREAVDDAIVQHGFAGVPTEKVSVRWIVVTENWGTKPKNFDAQVLATVPE